MTDELFDVAGKVALVTGGTSGIGTMIARGFVRRGVKTYIASRDQARSDAAAAELAAEGGTCIGLEADLGTPEGPAVLAEALRRHEDRLDILVNNAGANNPATIETMDMDGWDGAERQSAPACSS